MKAKLNNLIARYEKNLTDLNGKTFHSEVSNTQICMIESFIHSLKALKDK